LIEVYEDKYSQSLVLIVAHSRKPGKVDKWKSKDKKERRKRKKERIREREKKGEERERKWCYERRRAGRNKFRDGQYVVAHYPAPTISYHISLCIYSALPFL
tara:strand:- start:301 stop:606 length:306 start_codon:yes stop_codon:yes gene_type:complete